MEKEVEQYHKEMKDNRNQECKERTGPIEGRNSQSSGGKVLERLLQTEKREMRWGDEKKKKKDALE